MQKEGNNKNRAKLLRKKTEKQKRILIKSKVDYLTRTK